MCSGLLSVDCGDLVDTTGVKEAYHWHLSNVRLVENVPIKGRLNLYETPDDQIRVIGSVPDQGGEREAVRAQRRSPIVCGGGAAAIRRRKNA